jgi:two-component system sensor histidine kinase HydH
MPEGGLLSISVRRTEEGEAGALLVSVTDTGHGMSPEEIRTAFEPYFSSKEAGVGLGLALTRKIVEDHGGSIALESSPGQGTTVRISLPLATRPLPAGSVEAVAS